MADLFVDMDRLERMLGQLTPRQREKGVRAGLRRAAGEWRKTARQQLRAAGLKANRKVDLGIRAAVYRRKLGFKLTIGTKKTYTKKARSKRETSDRRLDIVPLWAEGGTVARRTARSIRRKSRPTGRMPQYEFMEATRRLLGESTARQIQTNVMRMVEKAVKDNGGSID